MNKLSFTFLTALLFSLSLFSNGIIIIDTEAQIYLTLTASRVETQVNNQVAVTKATQTFRNETGQAALAAKYAFPLRDGASATGLRWLVNGVWYEASIAAEPQDTSITGGGSGASEALLNYLGGAPLFFEFESTLIQADSLIVMELSYVELLPYAFNLVSFHYPNDYGLIQGGGAVEQQFEWQMESERTILNVEFPSHPGTVDVSDHNAHVSYAFSDGPADADYLVVYELSSDELGVFGMSTLLPDTLADCDEHGNGFLTLVIEPESNPGVDVIEKNFILVIDRSGSMSGNKMVQARDAASFIVQHLNPGDFFNIVAFDNDISTFSPILIPFSSSSQTNAPSFISAQNANGTTNISGALTTAIGQFSSVNPDKANIILFFTDGQPTAGITNPEGILAAVEMAVAQAETTIFLYAFGIGEDVNTQLLSALASQNNGLANFLGNEELEAAITEFFLKVNNPVLLSPQIQFSPPLVSELYPQPLPNLYKGQQLIITGRYEEAESVEMVLSGTAFNLPIVYNFTIDLADTLVPDYFFLPKLWAKGKIENLQQQYYLAGDNTPLADSLEDAAIALSICYGVISDFTSFTGPPVTSVQEFDPVKASSWHWEAGPNPFREQVGLSIFIPFDWYEPATIYILDSHGRIVASIPIMLGPAGDYRIDWEGLSSLGITLPKGTYYAILNLGGEWNTLTLVKQ
ncbi:MAG: VWA domain-containing protein [Saprospirales bacterium]|nr:VWA domain-containing protein [Saprospirales bacterium]